MAKYIVPSIDTKHTLIKCCRCKTLYEPETQVQKKYLSDRKYYENCPICGYDCNDYSAVIPLWKYNLIKFFRGGFKK